MITEDFIKKMCQEILNEKIEGISLDAQEMIDKIVDNIEGISEKDFEKKTSNTIIVRVSSGPDVEDRRKELRDKIDDKIEDITFAETSSTIGQLKYKSATLLIKPPKKVVGKESTKGSDEIGRDRNEMLLVNTLLDFLKTPKNIKIKDGTYIININDAFNIKQVGKNTKQYKKADIVIEGNKNHNFSIKRSDAVRWESADSRFSSAIDNLVDNPEKYGVIIKSNKRGDKTLKKSKQIIDINTGKNTKLAAKLTDNEMIKEIVFGGDECEAVIVETFKDDSFNFGENEVVIQVNKIIKSIDDIPEDKWPWLEIRKQDNRGKHGLRPEIRIQSEIKENKHTIVDINKLLK